MPTHPIPTPTEDQADGIGRIIADLTDTGWRHDATTPITGGTVERTLVHDATGQVIVATTGHALTELTLSGLTLGEVAGALVGAGLIAPGRQSEVTRLKAELARTRERLQAALTTGDSATILREIRGESR